MPQTASEIAERILLFLRREPAFAAGVPAQLDSEFPLLEAGVIDSLGVLKLVTFLEAEFKIKVRNLDVVERNFKDLASIARYVGERVAATGAG